MPALPAVAPAAWSIWPLLLTVTEPTLVAAPVFSAMTPLALLALLPLATRAFAPTVTETLPRLLAVALDCRASMPMVPAVRAVPATVGE